ncbi:hypothetical protein F53441_238 [Fusarium austroafricanum]|uniref:Uncharacterized protein n=1 Tax=Fusarium austroafricanum TaxID=2364996 RepID=A0A8H4KUU0_9HYPO|nr:hypothetical protein F53441_238 [Fusarium austroafricanum]
MRIDKGKVPAADSETQPPPFNIHLDRPVSPPFMGLNWLFHFRKLIVLLVANVKSEADRRAIKGEAQIVLLWLAVRNQRTPVETPLGTRVGNCIVTEEHLDKTFHYFDVRLLVTDARLSVARSNEHDDTFVAALSSKPNQGAGEQSFLRLN